MMCYADTGFLVKLYIGEPETQLAGATVKAASLPILISALSRLEVRNALELQVFHQKITTRQAAVAWGIFEEDLSSGLLELRALGNGELHERAIDLAAKYSAKLGARSLDLLHVAAALILGASSMLTFDRRQRRVAELEGLRVKPRI